MRKLSSTCTAPPLVEGGGDREVVGATPGLAGRDALGGGGGGFVRGVVKHGLARHRRSRREVAVQYVAFESKNLSR
jgi:hypothetical protein